MAENSKPQHASDAPEAVKGEDTDQVRVSLQSPFEGHRFIVPGDPKDEDSHDTVIDAGGVLVSREQADAISEAAARSGVTVKVDDK